MDPTTALASKISLAQSTIVEARDRSFGRDVFLAESELPELYSSCSSTASTGGTLVAFADEALLYTLCFDGESGAVNFFAMHFLDAIP